jgi:F0F1-type ATP synthase assembly protein I
VLAEAALTLLKEWESFYVIVGSSAGALTGLQFVVIALIAETRAASSMTTLRAFGTPTVVHFCAALLISAIASAPFHSLHSAAIGVGILGLLGVVYAIRVLRHARRQTGYRPDLADWIWYVVAPKVTYLLLAITATQLDAHPRPWLFVLAGIALALLILGIHNAWDTVTWIAVHRGDDAKP